LTGKVPESLEGHKSKFWVIWGIEVFMTKKETLSTGRQRWGRPRLNPETARSNRVVTFVTNGELAKLERIAEQERISLSAAAHRILSRLLKDA